MVVVVLVEWAMIPYPPYPYPPTPRRNRQATTPKPSPFFSLFFPCSDVALKPGERFFSFPRTKNRSSIPPLHPENPKPDPDPEPCPGGLVGWLDWLALGERRKEERRKPGESVCCAGPGNWGG